LAEVQDKMVREELSYDNEAYKKVQEYVYSLSDEELDEIGHALEKESFDEASSAEVVKKLIEISPKASRYLGKLV
jgi:digeranylgeranylglycerophospholipid reductase